MFNVTEERRSDLPGNLPAIWVRDQAGVTLYLRDDLAPDLVGHFRRMCRAAEVLDPTG